MNFYFIPSIGSGKERKELIIIFKKLECDGSTMNAGARSLTHSKFQRSHSVQPGIIINVHNDDP